MIEVRPTPLPARQRWLARALDAMTLIALAAIPLSLIAICFLNAGGGLGRAAEGALDLTGDWATPGVRLGAFFILLLPAAIGMFGLWRLRDFLRGCIRGHPFGRAALEGFRAFAFTRLLTAVLSPFVGAALSAYTTALNPDVQNAVTLSIGSDTLFEIFIALVFFLIAHLLVAAGEMNEEASAFV